MNIQDLPDICSLSDLNPLTQNRPSGTSVWSLSKALILSVPSSFEKQGRTA